MPLQRDFKDIVRPAEPLAPHTWFALGGPAEFFAVPRTIDELAALVERARDEEIPIRLLGGGSNILVNDQGVPGLVVQLSAPVFSSIEVAGARVKAGAGAKLGHVVSTSVREGLAGLETLVGIPGTVGGALRGNAGGRGGEGFASRVLASNHPDSARQKVRGGRLGPRQEGTGGVQQDRDHRELLKQRIIPSLT